MNYQGENPLGSIWVKKWGDIFFKPAYFVNQFATGGLTL